MSIKKKKSFGADFSQKLKTFTNDPYKDCIQQPANQDKQFYSNYKKTFK